MEKAKINCEASELKQAEDIHADINYYLAKH